MAFASTAVLDAPLDLISSTAAALRVVKNFTSADNYTAVVNKTVASAALVPGDFSKSDSGNDRVLTVAAKSPTATAASISSDNLSFVITSGSAILVQFEETTNQPINVGNVVNIPSLTYAVTKPVDA